jgi:hypothetical protein
MILAGSLAIGWCWGLGEPSIPALSTTPVRQAIAQEAHLLEALAQQLCNEQLSPAQREQIAGHWKKHPETKRSSNT